MFPDNDRQQYNFGGHFTAFALVLAGVVALGGCVQAPVRGGAHAAASQPLARLDLPTDTPAARASALLIAAQFALQHQDVTSAAHDYARAARLSTDPQVARRAFTLALAERDADGAQGLLQRWRALGASPAELAGGRARLAMLEGDTAKAEQQFGIMLASGDATTWKNFLSYLLDAHDRAQAGRVLEALATPARLPPDEKVWVACSQLGERLDRHAFARGLADAAVDRFHDVDGIRWAASLRMNDGDRAGARALYADGVRAHPENVDLRLGYAALLGGEGKYAEARRVLAHGPQTDATWSARVAYAARAKDKPALRRLYAALQHEPASGRQGSEFLLGQLAELLKHDRQALRWYDQVEPGSRRSFEARVRRAVLLDKLGHSTEAHALAQRLEQDYADDPDNLRTAFELDAQMYSRRGEHARALAVYERALAALPGDPVLLYDRGVEHANAGNVDAALADFRQVLHLKPGNVEAMNALGFTLADADRDLPEATKLLRRALAARPDEPAILDSWGWLQYRLGHFEKAEHYLRRAWDKGRDPEVGVHLGEVLWKLGRHQHAREVFATVRKLDPDNAALRRVTRDLQP